MQIFGVAGWKNSGKTGLMERLVTDITGRGFSVSTIKHAHHTFDVDQPGKDSHRHRLAGASEVMLVSRNRWALMHEMRDADEPPLTEILSKIAPVDLILIEGYKSEPHAKIEAHRGATGRPLLATDDDTIQAVASDQKISDFDREVFDLDDTNSIAAFILKQTGLSA